MRTRPPGPLGRRRPASGRWQGTWSWYGASRRRPAVARLLARERAESIRLLEQLLVGPDEAPDLTGEPVQDLPGIVDLGGLVDLADGSSAESESA